MRIWSVHPKYLDNAGLIAAWREGLLAQRVLAGETKGYRHHPQLKRFQEDPDGRCILDGYLWGIWHEQDRRGYRYNHDLIIDLGWARPGPLGRPYVPTMDVTEGQLRYEAGWLEYKKVGRKRFGGGVGCPAVPDPSPVFTVVPGAVEPWERPRADILAVVAGAGASETRTRR